jgi:exodeoxyribonuclease VII large subunit
VLKPEEAQRPLTVTELANEIRRELRPLTALLVKGEVTGMKQGSKGHYSFSIRDSQSLINALIFADDAKRLAMLPEDGQVFLFRGRIDYWTQYGTIRLIVDQVEFDDVGKLRARLEELKRRLELEGAFDPKRKRRLPFLPTSVALLTSPTGAVIHDLQETIWERYPNMGIVVYPVQVQGAAAPMSVARALRRCNAERLADVIVLARGGGSFEDLLAFSDERLVRAVAGAPVPVVSAVGHEQDSPLCDLAADVRASTPTMAGKLVVPELSQLFGKLDHARAALAQSVQRTLERDAQQLERSKERLRAAPRLALDRETQRVERAHERLRRAPSLAVERKRAGLESVAGKLRVLSPLKTLERGYAIVRTDSGVVTSTSDVKDGTHVDVRVADGSFGATVDESSA